MIAIDRPLTRLFDRGSQALSQAELLSLLLDGGSLDQANDLLHRHAGLAGLAQVSPDTLEQLGLGDLEAARVLAALELGRRLLSDWPTNRGRINESADIADTLVIQMGRLESEEMRVVLLDSKNHVIRIRTVYMGTVTETTVRVAELFREAVRLNASGIIMAHNHPSGDPTPSPADLHLTAQAIAAGSLLGIDLLDHLVIGHDAYESLRDRGMTFSRPEGDS